MLYKKNWPETREKWINYWKQQNTGRPLMHVLARKPEIENYVGQKAPGGVNDSIICQGRYYTLPDGTWLTVLACDDVTDYCWLRY